MSFVAVDAALPLFQVNRVVGFARGVTPDDAALAETVVRRLKNTIVNDDGSRRFRQRETHPLPVEYPDDEREVHALLTRFAELRRTRLRPQRGHRATDLITLLLKKRLFSSPAVLLAGRLRPHGRGLHADAAGPRRRRPGRHATPPQFDEEKWYDEFLDELDTLDDEQLGEAEDGALGTSTRLAPEAGEDELALLSQMDNWARAHEGCADAKAQELIGFLQAVCRPDGSLWTNERVLVFAVYRDTQQWLERLPRQHGLGEERLALLYGGMAADERELLRLAFQKDPAEHPVRILLATDAASEGIDLQNHCHRLVNYDIPFNPNKLEQRIGRIDRYGQRHHPQVYHFVGTGWEKMGPTQLTANLDRFAATLRDKLGEEPEVDLLTWLKDPKELAQARQDRRAWAQRLEQLDIDRERQTARIAARYAERQPYTFPVPVVCVMPEREAAR